MLTNNVQQNINEHITFTKITLSDHLILEQEYDNYIFNSLIHDMITVKQINVDLQFFTHHGTTIVLESLDNNILNIQNNINETHKIVTEAVRESYLPKYFCTLTLSIISICLKPITVIVIIPIAGIAKYLKYL